MKLYTYDFETYYDSEYSLSKVTTEEYIRDRRFEVVGVSVRERDKETQWFTGPFEETKEWLEQFELHKHMVVAHNGMFDHAILGWRFGIHPKVLGDTLSMARAHLPTGTRLSLAALAQYFGLPAKGTAVTRALGKRRESFTMQEMEEYADYCAHDTWLCEQIFLKLLDLGFPKGELKVIDATLRMYTDPALELDLPLLEQHLIDVRERKAKLLESAAVERSELMSNQKFAELLRSLGVEPPTKISPTTGKPTLAFAKTDQAFLDLQEHEDERVQALVAARLGTKSTLEETRTERFIAIAKRGTFPIPLTYSTAITHRWGGADKVNLQNIPSRDKRKMALKRSIKAPEGYVIINSDQSQIEARVLPWLAGEDSLVDDFAAQDAYVGPKESRPDVYKKMAGRIFGLVIEQITGDQRFIGKTVTLGAGYGLGPPTFRTHMIREGRQMSEREAFDIITAYRNANPKIVEFWWECNRMLDLMAMGQAGLLGKHNALWVEGNSIILPNNLRITYNNLRKILVESKKLTDPNEPPREAYVYDGKIPKTRIYGPKITENVVQAVARCIVAEQIPKIAAKWKVVLTVHDSIVVMVPKAKEAEAVEDIYRIMRTAPKWANGLPLNCEVSVGYNYGDMEIVK